MGLGLISSLQKQPEKYPRITWVAFMCSSKRTLEHPLTGTKERAWASPLVPINSEILIFFFQGKYVLAMIEFEVRAYFPGL